MMIRPEIQSEINATSEAVAKLRAALMTPPPETRVKLSDLATLSATLAQHRDISVSRLAEVAGFHNRLFVRAAKGQSCRVDTFIAALEWLSANWPADLEWPRDIPRPQAPKKEKAA